MLRLTLLFLLLCAPAGTKAALPPAAPLLPSPAFQPRGPEQARGALVWLSDADGTGDLPPPEPAWLRHAANHGYDIWRFDRMLGLVSLAGEQLATGLAALRAGGYRRLIVAGQSRGGWIALTVLSHPGLADGVAAFAPAAHGTDAARQPQALADFDGLLHAAGHAPDTRLVIALFADDPLDPGPQAREDRIRELGRNQAIKLLPIFRPSQPRGHDGVYDPAFDRLFGARIVRFLDPEAKRVSPDPPMRP